MVAAARRDLAAAGFTLPELLATLAIMATLAAIAAPSVSSLIAGQRAKAASSELFASLMRVRSEAVKRNAEVTLVPKDGGWKHGWTIPNPADTGHKIEDHAALAGATVTGPDSVVYLPNGRVKGTNAPSFDIAVTNAATHRCVQVDLSGRPYLKPSAC
jgi:type IV fimbrial biogenesis protein FimT